MVTALARLQARYYEDRRQGMTIRPSFHDLWLYESSGYSFLCKSVRGSNSVTTYKQGTGFIHRDFHSIYTLGFVHAGDLDSSGSPHYSSKRFLEAEQNIHASRRRRNNALLLRVSAAGNPNPLG